MAENLKQGLEMEKENTPDSDPWGKLSMILVHRDRKGFGFTLRHFIVYPPDPQQVTRKSSSQVEGSEVKRSKITTCEPMDTIFVKQVKEGGPAHSAGLRKGDRIVSVNGQNVTGRSYSQVVALIQASDQSLKLLVVPKDEDALQMAYQCSVYAQGKDPYRGSADDIPEPPQFAKPPLVPRYKSELKVVPEDGRLDNQIDQLTSHDLVPRQRTSFSSVSSSSTGSGSGHVGSRDSLHRTAINIGEQIPSNAKYSSNSSKEPRTDIQPVGLSHSYHGTIQSKDSTAHLGTSALNSSAPPVQSRTSSRNILLKYPESSSGRNRAGSLDSLSRSSDSSGASRRSHDTAGIGGNSSGVVAGQRSSMPIQTKQAFDSIEISAFSQPIIQQYTDMGNGLKKRSRSRDRDYKLQQQQTYTGSISHGSKENISNSNNRGSSSGTRSSTDELRRRFFENGGLGPTTTSAVNVGGSPINTSNRYKQPYTRANTTANVSFEPHSSMTGGSPFGINISIHNNIVPTTAVTTAMSQPDVNSGSSRLHFSSSASSRPKYDGSPSMGLHQRVFSPVNLTSTPRYGQPLQQKYSSSHGQSIDFKPIDSTPLSQSDSYGLTVSLSTVGSANVDTSGRGSSSHKYLDDVDSLYSNTPQQRLSLQEPNNINLVTERMKLYESDSNIDAAKSSPVVKSNKDYHRSRSPRLDLMQKGPQPYGSNSVALKAAFYENKDKGQTTANIWGSGHNSMGSSTSSLLQSLPLDDLQKNSSTPVSTIPFYFRTETPPVPVEKSPEKIQKQGRSQHVGSSPHVDIHARSRSRDRDHSPMTGSFQDLQFDLSPSPEPREFRRQRPTRRQPSYLSAIDNAKLTAYLDRLHSNQPLHASVDSVTAADTYERLADTWPQFQQWSSSGQAKSLESLSGKLQSQLYSLQQQPSHNNQYSEDYPSSYGSSVSGGGSSHSVKKQQYLSPYSAYKSYQTDSNQSDSNRNVNSQTSYNRNEDDGGFSRFTSNVRAVKKGTVDVEDGESDPVRLRTTYNTSQEDRDNKIMRRSSYLMATRQASTGAAPSGDTGNQESVAVSESGGAESQIVELHTGLPQPFKRQERSKLKLTLRGHQQGLGSYGVAYSTNPTQMSPIPQSPRTPVSPKMSPQSPTSPSDVTTGSSGSGSKQPKNIKKLKAFFGERTPKIVEAQKTANDLPPSPIADVLLEGTLSCKLAMTDGKRSSDRSWKPMWAVLRGQALFLYKDKASVSPLIFEETPISIKFCAVDIAYDYTKKKKFNVFRMTTANDSEYLFQADDNTSMLNWIKAIQDNSNSDKDVGVSHDWITKSPPQQMAQCPVKVKQKPSRSLRSKSPAAHSPGLKQKKQASKDEYGESPKVNKTWKGKMVKKFKRSGSSSNNVISESSEVESQATFGVPIEDCPASTFSEFVPFAVEVCTKIVEAKGLENQGIYRVPGNNGAVNMLQAELDKGPDLVDMDNEKWLDINVVSSLLKSFFRKLPDPLITEELYHSIIHANRIEDQEKRMLKIKKILHDMPEHNFETFSYLGEHLARVIANEELNKMDARNIAIVFGPTLIRTAEDSMITMVKDMSDQCRIIESIVSHPSWFFGSWDEDVYVPIDKQTEGCMPYSGMNQQLINKAENMQLGERGKEFSAKDLVSSVFSAANKKVRRRDKTKGDSIDGDMESESGYNERNIDAEIEIRSKQIQQQQQQESSSTTVTSTTTSSSSQHLQQHQMTQSSSKLEMKSSSTSAAASASSSSIVNSCNSKLQSASSSSQSTSRIESLSSQQYSSTSTTTSAMTKSMQMSEHKDSMSSLPSATTTTTTSGTLAITSASVPTLTKASSIQGPFPSELTGSETEQSRASKTHDLYSAKMVFFQQPPQPVSLQPHFTLGPANWTGPPPGRKGSLGSDGTVGSGDREDLQVKRYPAYPQPDLRSYSTETSKPIIHYKYNPSQRGITPPPGGVVSSLRGRSSQQPKQKQPTQQQQQQQQDSHSLKYHTQQNLKRMEFETKAMKKKEIERQREKEQRELAKQRIEMELQKTKEELEQEDEFDDLYPKPLYSVSSQQQTSGKGDGGAQGQKMDNSSVFSDFTSDYSTNSSNTNTLDSKASLRVPGYASDYSSSASPSISRMQQQCGGRRDVSPQPFSGWSGKYFVLSSNSASPKLDKRTSHDDMELYRHPSPREKAAGAFDFASTVSGDGGKYLTVNDHHHRVRRASGNQRKEGLGRHGGSLDSLIDQYEAMNYSYCESDSEEHDDLVMSLTATFDQKMKSLVESPDSSVNAAGSSSSSTCGPGQIILAQGDQQHFVPSSFVDKFRDPSLHRVTPPKGDPKIGIACRFERRDIDSQFHGLKRGEEYSAFTGVPPHLQKQSYLTQGTSEDKMTKSPSVAKSEKTDTNLNIKCNRTPHAKIYAQAIRKSGEKLFGSRENLLLINSTTGTNSSSSQATEESLRSPVTLMHRTPSPPPSGQRSKRPRERRRHTVGGTHDTEHMNALLAATQSSNVNKPERLSAWERLQPGLATKNSDDCDEAPPRDLHSWLRQQQRLRAVKSTPSLTDPNLVYGSGNNVYYNSGRFDPHQQLGTYNNANPLNFGFYEYDAFSPSENRRKRRLQSQRSNDSSSGGTVSPSYNSSSNSSSVVHNVYQDTQLRTRPGGFTFESSI